MEKPSVLEHTFGKAIRRFIDYSFNALRVERNNYQSPDFFQIKERFDSYCVGDNPEVDTLQANDL